MRVAALVAGLMLGAGAANAQTAPEAAASEWRRVAPENLLVIDTSRGRVLVELAATVAPGHVERVRTLANQGFYDGLKFHRVIANFMAQTGDPLGTGEGGSTLPDIAAEISFRRGRDSGFVPVTMAAPITGLVGSLPILTQPDAQMFVTADMRVGANGLFCPGTAGMARSQGLNSANSQFFLMTGRRETLDGQYTAFGRVISGLEAVQALKTGLDTNDGAVGEDADTMTRVRTAEALPEGERPTARILDPRSARFAALLEQTRTERGARLTVCDIELPAEITGG